MVYPCPQEYRKPLINLLCLWWRIRNTGIYSNIHRLDRQFGRYYSSEKDNIYRTKKSRIIISWLKKKKKNMEN